MLKLWNKTIGITGKKLSEIAPEFNNFIPILEEVWDTGKLYLAKETFADIEMDGNLIPIKFDFAYQPILDEQGNTYAIINTTSDVTERVRLSEKLKEKEVVEIDMNSRLLEAIEELNLSNEQLATLNEEYLSTNQELTATLEQVALGNRNFDNANYKLIELNNELEVNRKQLNNALQAAELGSYNLDLSTMLMECSDQCKINFGVPVENRFDFKDLIDAIMPEYRDVVNEKVSASIAGNLPYNVEYQVKRPDGSIHWIQANGTPQYDIMGKPLKMVGVTQLITEKKNYQSRKDEFLSVASHELKTPITVLKANLQLLDRLKSKIQDESAIKMIDSCNRSMDKINSMLSELLDIGKYSDGKIDLQFSAFDINDLLSSCIEHLDADDYKKIQIKSVGAQVIADQNRIEQVLVNFVNNAIKYAPSTAYIILSSELIVNAIRVSVRDFGAGIPSVNIPMLFDRYWQGDKKQISSNGLGLGLYICAEIIKKHGGQIGVDSEIGKGSTFWFELPLIKS
ncbi:ATP-binding protein [Pedobacter sp. AW31-3R]|uniref:ATP-binding protein n=1 Tax=Pedobacter sp. AW31-3R TaxID=3445781 RepID=UPI003F9F2078